MIALFALGVVGVSFALAHKFSDLFEDERALHRVEMLEAPIARHRSDP